MEVIEILRQVSKQVFDNVKNLSITEYTTGDLAEVLVEIFHKILTS